MREFDDKDDIRIGNDFYISFLYAAGDGRGADKGVNYGAKDPLNDDDFLKVIFLELKTDNVVLSQEYFILFPTKPCLPDKQAQSPQTCLSADRPA